MDLTSKRPRHCHSVKHPFSQPLFDSYGPPNSESLWQVPSTPYPSVLSQNSFNFWGPSYGGHNSVIANNPSSSRYQAGKKRKKSTSSVSSNASDLLEIKDNRRNFYKNQDQAKRCCSQSDAINLLNVVNQENNGPPTLLDLAAKMTARCYSGHLIDERLSGRVPEPVQKRLLFWAFPDDEKKIQLYSSKAQQNPDCNCLRNQDQLEPTNDCVFCGDQTMSPPFDPQLSTGSTASKVDNQDASAFVEGLRCYKNCCVNDAMQIGYLLTGTVCYGKPQSSNYKVVHVALSFDRCRITSILCNCDRRDIYWCHHAVALALFRIRKPECVKYRFALSDSLLQLDRMQLQKLVQYLLAKSYRKVDLLPLAQHLIDDLMINDSKINRIKGAPDVTMGLTLENTWYFDENQVRSLVRSYLTHAFRFDELQQLFEKVREMLKHQDENGPKFLRLITEEFLCALSSASNIRVSALPHSSPLSSASNGHYVGGTTSANSTAGQNRSSGQCERMQELWDEIGILWVCVVMNPNISSKTRTDWQQLLKSWMLLPNCPTESTFSLPYNSFCEAHAYRVNGCSNKCIFSYAYDACSNKYLNCQAGSEPIHVSCAQIESLRVNGHHNDSLNLAVKLASRLIKDKISPPSETYYDNPFYETSFDSLLIGHGLDPANCLFNCLFESDVQKENITAHVGTVSKNGSRNSFIRCLAVESALALCATPRPYVNCRYFKEKINRQEDKLLEKLMRIDYSKNESLYQVVKNRALIILNDFKEAAFTCTLMPSRYFPLYNLAYFLFKVLLNQDPDLAYEIGLTVLKNRLPEDGSVEVSLLGSMINWPTEKSFETSTLKSKETNLASSLIVAAKDDPSRLSSVLNAIRLSIVCPLLMCQLAYDVFGESMNYPDGSQSRSNLLNIAFELGLQILKAPTNQLKWCRPNVVRWVVNCATSLSLNSVLYLIRHWSEYFSAIEAVSVVARAIWTESVNVSLKLDANQRVTLSYCVQEMALECVMRSPADCSLHALSICKNNEKTFEAAFQIIVKAGEQGTIAVEDLFNIAQHMERLMLLPKAYQLSLIALKHCRVGYLDDNCASTSGVYWAVTLAKSMGRFELNHVTRLFCDIVRSPVVLTNIFKICIAPHSQASLTGGSTGAYSQPHHQQPQYLSYCRYLDKQTINMNAARSALLTDPHLHILLDATITSYIESVHGRLSHISPRHYCEFIDFLFRARDVFSLADNGDRQFAYFLEHMKIVYKGKKKLVALIKQKIG